MSPPRTLIVVAETHYSISCETHRQTYSISRTKSQNLCSWSSADRLDCFFSRLFKRGSRNTSKLRVTGLCEGNHRSPVDSPHKWPVTREMFPFDDVITFDKYIEHFRDVLNSDDVSTACQYDLPGCKAAYIWVNIQRQGDYSLGEANE